MLLGESSHAEVLKRSSPLFRFLFRNKKLSLEKVDSICDLAMEKHDTYRKHIINILLDLAELMEIEQRQYLFDKVRNFSTQEIDYDILQLIKIIGVSKTGKKESDIHKNSPSHKKEVKSPWRDNSYQVLLKIKLILMLKRMREMSTPTKLLLITMKRKIWMQG